MSSLAINTRHHSKHAFQAWPHLTLRTVIPIYILLTSAPPTPTFTIEVVADEVDIITEEAHTPAATTRNLVIRYTKR